MMKQSTASRLKELMQARNLQQNELLEACNRVCREIGAKPIGKSSMSQYVNGIVEPKQDRLYIMARAFNVPETWLMGWDDEDEAEPMPEMPLGVAARQQKPADEPKQQPSIDELISQLQELKRRQCAGAYNLTQDEQELIDDYRTLSQPMKLKARKIIGALADRMEE